MSWCNSDTEESNDTADVESMDSNTNAAENEDLLFELENEDDKSVCDNDNSKTSGGRRTTTNKQTHPSPLAGRLMVAMQTRAV